VVLATAESDTAVLVDAGPDAGPVSACLDRLGVRRLALVVLSHLHADHLGGLAGVLRGRAVSAVALGPGPSPSWAFADGVRTTTEAGVPLVALTAGQQLSWPGLGLEVLAPLRAPAPSADRDAEVDGTEVNNTSVVLRATTPAGRVLLTGDVELQAQADLLAARTDLRAEVLKVPHHGSRSSLPGFLTAPGARLAVVSVGRGNGYGHPNPGVLGLLAHTGALVRRTDESGDLAVVTGADRRPAVVARGEPRPDPRRR